jgi:hypothetical protein
MIDPPMTDHPIGIWRETDLTFDTVLLRTFTLFPPRGSGIDNPPLAVLLLLLLEPTHPWQEIEAYNAPAAIPSVGLPFCP